MNKILSFFHSGDKELSMKRACAFLLVLTAISETIIANLNGHEAYGLGEILATALALLSVEPVTKAVSSFSNNNANENTTDESTIISSNAGLGEEHQGK